MKAFCIILAKQKVSIVLNISICFYNNFDFCSFCFSSGSRSVDVVGLLLHAGTDVNAKNVLGMNALLLVAGYGNDLLVRMVLDADARPDSSNNFGHSALHLAVLGKRSQVTALTSGRGGTSLYGLNRRNLDQVLLDWVRDHKDLLNNGRADDKVYEKASQFMMGVGDRLIEGDLTTTDEEALKKRVDTVSRYRTDKVLQALKDTKKTGVVDTLLSCGGRRSKQAKASSGNAPLSAPRDRPPVGETSPEVDHDIADLSIQFAQIVRRLLDAGCEVDKVECAFGLTALDMAMMFGDVESTAMMLAAGGDPDHLLKVLALTDLHGNISVRPDKKRVKALLESDPNLNINESFQNANVSVRVSDEDKEEMKGDEGLTPLAVAAKAQDNSTVDIIKMLIKKGEIKLDVSLQSFDIDHYIRLSFILFFSKFNPSVICSLSCLLQHYSLVIMSFLRIIFLFKFLFKYLSSFHHFHHFHHFITLQFLQPSYLVAPIPLIHIRSMSECDNFDLLCQSMFTLHVETSVAISFPSVAFKS